MERYLYSELAGTIDAYRRCTSKGANESQSSWATKHGEHIAKLVYEHMPSGSGFDNGTQIDVDASHAEKLVFTTSYHHMNDGGYYDGWTEHTVTVTPSFSGIHIRVSGRNRNEIKDYIHEMFHSALKTVVSV